MTASHLGLCIQLQYTHIYNLSDSQLVVKQIMKLIR
jgi:hypothetical protein